MQLAIFTLFALIACGQAASIEAQARGPIIWQEEFDYFDGGKWKHLITAWRGGNNEFQYYDNLGENRYKTTLLHIISGLSYNVIIC